MLQIGVLGSGRGSNLQAILTAIDDGRIPGARVCVVISNNSAAGILDIARGRGIPALHLSQKGCGGEQGLEAALRAALHTHGATLIALAGYMKRLPAAVVAEYRNRTVNIHPALLPLHGGPGMYGSHVHEAVLAAGERVSGATVHYVDEEYDHGAILVQKTVPVLPGDTADTLAARVLAVEHEIYPVAIRLIAEGRAYVPPPHAAPH